MFRFSFILKKKQFFVEDSISLDQQSINEREAVDNAEENLLSIPEAPPVTEEIPELPAVIGKPTETVTEIGNVETRKEIPSLTIENDSILAVAADGNDGQHDLIHHPDAVPTSISTLPEANYRNNGIATSQKDEQSNPLEDDENRIKFVQSNGTNNHLISVSVDDSEPGSIVDVSLFKANSLNSIPAVISGQVDNEVEENAQDASLTNQRKSEASEDTSDFADHKTEVLLQDVHQQENIPAETVANGENVANSSEYVLATVTNEIPVDSILEPVENLTNNSIPSTCHPSQPQHSINSTTDENKLTATPVLLLETMVNKKMQLTVVTNDSAKSRAGGRKLHLIRNHLFAARWFGMRPSCHVCKERFPFRLGKQGYQCRLCLLICHKACHVRVVDQCSNPIDLTNHLH